MTFQIWDFSSAEKIKDVPPDPMGQTQVCYQLLTSFPLSDYLHIVGMIPYILRNRGASRQ